MQKFDPNYFLETPAHILENTNIREPQKQAYYQIYKHFILDKKSTHALVVLPTGVGKTGVIGIAPFHICEGRTLIITPQLAVKDTVVDSLNPENHDNFWSTRKVLGSKQDLPVVVEYEGKDTKSEILECSSIVILNIHKLQERLDSSLLKAVQTNFFDMIIVDEAHHSTANTWVEALNYFSSAKVIKITGTPFRSDGEKISGELIYEYKLSQAMANGYVKSLVKSDFLSEDVQFICDGDEGKLYSEEDILKIKDEDWVSRTVAYSEACSRQVVDKSIEILAEKQKNSTIPHKIIAVACSISHAEQIKSFYAESGKRTAIVHSDLSITQIEEAKNDIKNHRVDVIVNVGMLGEGYDHKYLSIAAIFRPFRNSLPYEQFIGRILRIIPEATTPEDNIGRVVSHKLLYLDTLWQKYKNEYDESEIIKSLIEENMPPESDDSPDDSPGGSSGTVSELDIGKAYSGEGELIDDPYLETEILKKKKEESELLNKKIKELAKVLDTTEENARRIIETERSKQNRLTRPDTMYKRARRDIDTRIREEIVPELVVKHVPDSSESLEQCRLFWDKDYKWIPSQTKNAAALLAMYFNQYLKVQIGKSRDFWSMSDYERANELLDKQYEYVNGILINFYSNT